MRKGLQMSSYSAQLREEQQAVSRAYGRLDDLRAQARARLDTVRAAGSHGSPTQRTERDSFATMYEDRLTQLRAVEDRLVFGRLDDVTVRTDTSGVSDCPTKTTSRSSPIGEPTRHVRSTKRRLPIMRYRNAPPYHTQLP